MTNVPFDENEAQYFRDNESGNSADQDYPYLRLKTALEIVLYSKVTGAPYANAPQKICHIPDGCKDYLRLGPSY